MNGLHVNILVAVRYLSWFCCCNNWCRLLQPKTIFGDLNKIMVFALEVGNLRNFFSRIIWRLKKVIMEVLILVLLTLRGYFSIFNYFVWLWLVSVLYAWNCVIWKQVMVLCCFLSQVQDSVSIKLGRNVDYVRKKTLTY